MAHWLFPANTKFYDVMGAFDAPETYWPMNAKVSVGDIVYIYLAAPYKQIGYICEVMDVGLELDSIIEHIRPYFKENQKGAKDDGKPSKPFIKLQNKRAIKLDKDSPVALAYLKENGLNGMLMGPRKLENNPPLLGYVQASLH